MEFEPQQPPPHDAEPARPAPAARDDETVPLATLARGTVQKRPRELGLRDFLGGVINLVLDDASLASLRGVVDACPRLRSLYAARNALESLHTLDPSAADGKGGDVEQ